MLHPWIVSPVAVLVLMALMCSSAPTAPEPTTAPPRFDPQSISWNNPLPDPAPGVEHHTLHSAAMDKEVGYNIYLPPGYHDPANAEKRYPVVYWLHGSHGNENLAANLLAVALAQAIQAGRVPPMIYVFANGGRFSSYMDHPDNEVKSETLIIQELIPHVDATYRTIASREGRGVEGFSMGGAGALKFAFKHPDMFCSAISVAGAFVSVEESLGRGGIDDPRVVEAIRENNTAERARRHAEQIRGRIGIRLYVSEQDLTLRFHAPFRAVLDELGIEHQMILLQQARHDVRDYYPQMTPGTFEFHARQFGLLGPADPEAPLVPPERQQRPTTLRTFDLDPLMPPPRVERKTVIYRTAPTSHGEVDLLMDLYMPTNRKKVAVKPPVILWVHGGGWLEGSRYRIEGLLLAEHGYAVASIEYRYSQEMPYPAQVQDAKAAVRWLRAHGQELGLDTRRIGAAGASAGGQIAAVLGVSAGDPRFVDNHDPNAGQSDRVLAVADFYGPADLSYVLEIPSLSPGARYAVEAYLGGPLEERKDLLDLASATTMITPDDPPFLIVQGDADTLVPVEMSRRLHAALQEAGVESTYVEIPGGEHGVPWEAFFGAPEARRRLVDFFDKHVKHAAIE
ncbi:MAG: alpha/beta hydrolase fold domain-containing protein [Phycisphaeraceae bacterium]|nr:alpha/beta hydrolase fold domain-containing protein [Phycisphaeraceae bacterium]